MGRSLRRMNRIKNNEMGWTCGTYGDRRGAYRIWVTRPEGKRNLADLGVDGRIILNWFFKKWDGDRDRTDLAQKRDRWWGRCECGNDPSVSVKCGEFLDWLRNS